MIYEASNGKISIAVKKFGAELCSLKLGEKECVWQADPEFWGSHGPLLFPIVGQINDGKIKIGGKDCHMPTHGFLSGMEFDMVEQTKDSITLSAKYNDETLSQYPFKFEVVATYKVCDKTLVGEYEIKNLGEETMPYGFGLHNGFYCLEDGEVIEDVYIKFEKPITINKPTRTPDSFMDFSTCIPVIENSDTLYLKNEWFPKQAPIIDNVTFSSFKLCHKQRGEILRYSFSEGFDMFNAWRAYNSRFICLEPWSSQSGVYPFAKNLEEAKHTKYLKPNESKVYSFSVEL